jgi:pimeloyl-ACP methyl ester carboxylesterase
MGRSLVPIVAVLLSSLAPAGCRRHHENERVVAEPAVRGNDATAASSAAGGTTSALPAREARPADPLPAPAKVEAVLVPGDLVASVVRSKDGAPPVTVFMPGMCSNGNAYLQTFPEAARKHGGVVAIEGDQPCGASGFRTFSWDAGRQHARVEAALAAAGLAEIPRGGITLVGYSQGAALAEQMVQRWPDRYARVVLIGAPTDPAPKNFARARAVVTMSCSLDVPARMKQAAQATSRAGVPATYFEMPGCRHGNVAEAERIFDETFDWLRANERAADPHAAAIPIVGSPAS